jgi:hypothetical protein
MLFGYRNVESEPDIVEHAVSFGIRKYVVYEEVPL